MKSLRILPCVLVLGSLAVPAFAQKSMRFEAAHRVSTRLLEANPSMPYDPTTLLVRFKKDQSATEVRNLRMAVGTGKIADFKLVERLELIAIDVPVEQAIQTLEPYVEYAEPNWVQRPNQTVPNDQYFSLQWGCNNTGQTILGRVGVPDADIDAVEAWDVTTGAPNFVVANIDTGVDWDHPDLAANIWSNPGEVVNGIDDDGNGYVDDVRGWDFYNNDSNPDDAEGHGSHTAGTTGAVGNNGIGVAGVAWNCRIVPLRFLGPQGGFTSDAILAVEYCTTMGIKVSNNSWGGGGFSTGLYNAINAAKSVGHVFVAAAGNSGVDNDALPHYPSSYDLDNIISVAAIDNQDNLANESTWGSNYGATSVDLGAPGVDIASTWASAGYVWAGGTSMATPHVTGVVVLLYSQNPGWSYSQVIDRILTTVRPTSAMNGVCTTGGVLDAFAAVSGGGGGDVTPPASPTGLAATAGDGSVGLDWDDNGEPDLAGYRVYRSTTSGSGYVDVSGLIGASAYTDSSVVNGQTYFYVVTAEDTSGNESGASSEVGATPQAGPDVTPPANPSGLGAVAGDGSVSLDWNDNGEPDLAGYRVYRSTTSGSGYAAVSGLVGTSAFVDGSVVNGVTYFYVVTAEDTSGNESGASNEASATPGSTGGQVQVLFADGFESGDFSSGGWSTSGNPLVNTNASWSGTYGARIRGTSWIERSISTVGYDSIEISYARSASRLDSGELLFVEYWNGSGWVAIEATGSTGWASQTFSLGTDASDNSSFAIRFRTNANRNNERADVDDVEVVGTTL